MSRLRLMRRLGARGYLRWMPGAMYLKLLYRSELGKKLNLKHPAAFNEKLQWLKLHDRNSVYGVYADKYAVRAHIEKTLGAQYLIPLLGVYDEPGQIDWDALPDRFVVKCTHGSHCSILCCDKAQFDRAAAVERLNRWLKKSWYWLGREWPYRCIEKPRVIVEEFLGNLDNPPPDCKVMCFDGTPRILQIHSKAASGGHAIDFYDMQGRLLPLRKCGFPNAGAEVLDMAPYGEMIGLAGRLSQGFAYLRADFYLVYGRVYFGEMTFFDSSGLIDFEPEESNLFLGALLRLPGEAN